jgi:hypothetical protein
VSLKDYVTSWTLDLKSRAADFSTAKVVTELKQASTAASSMATTHAQAWKRAQTDARETGHRMADDARETGREVTANLGEGIASGDFSNIIMDSVGGLVTGLKGPAAAALLGFGVLAATVWSNLKKEAEQANAAVEAFLGNLNAGQAELNTREARETAMAALGETRLDQMAKLRELASQVGVTEAEMLTYLSGATPETQAQARAFETIAEKLRTGGDDSRRVGRNLRNTKTEAELAALEADKLRANTVAAAEAAERINAAIAGIPTNKRVTIIQSTVTGRNMRLPLD